MKIMNNSNMTFHIPDPHTWTNITVIVKNQCRESLIPVSFNSTGELTVVWIWTEMTHVLLCLLFLVECPTSPTTTTTTEMTGKTNRVCTRNVKDSSWLLQYLPTYPASQHHSHHHHCLHQLPVMLWSLIDVWSNLMISLFPSIMWQILLLVLCGHMVLVLYCYW